MGDITYLPLGNGEFLYLATVLDCFSQEAVGWSIADHMSTGLVADALKMASPTRGGLVGAVFHSDHGAQYASRATLKSAGQQGFDKVRERSGLARKMPQPRTSAPLSRERHSGPKSLAGRAPGAARRLPLADPIQHPTPALPPRPAGPDRLREELPTNSNYSGPSRIDVFKFRGQGPQGT
ncbi:DDE-type integrase/transposase/recombinase [Streptomyces globisporus]|uniref:DDE-type integrase/transposase/recombinase n=1 Tax=Streptomyces globisporus TaxID=1908 RepID=UPI0038671A3C